MSTLYAHPVPEPLRNLHPRAAMQAQGSDNNHLSLPTSAQVYANGSHGKRLQSILPDSAAARLYLGACWTDATRRAYASDVRDFVAWGKQPGNLGLSCSELLDTLTSA